MSVSQATRLRGSCASRASRTPSLIWSAILSGWPSVTDSDVKRRRATVLLGKVVSVLAAECSGHGVLRRAPESSVLSTETFPYQVPDNVGQVLLGLLGQLHAGTVGAEHDRGVAIGAEGA